MLLAKNQPRTKLHLKLLFINEKEETTEKVEKGEGKRKREGKDKKRRRREDLSPLSLLSCLIKHLLFPSYLHYRKQIFHFIHIFKSLTDFHNASGVVRPEKDNKLMLVQVEEDEEESEKSDYIFQTPQKSYAK